MYFAPLLAAGLLAAASVQHTDAARTSHVVAQDNAVAVTAPEGPQHGVPAPPAVGRPAPDFTYQSFDYQWRNLHHMLAQGSVLLVFGASDVQLEQLQADSDALLQHDIVPVAVVGAAEPDVWSIVQRCRLTYSLLSDPHTALAEQFGAVDSTLHAVPSWFVIDPAGRIRGEGFGMPTTDWLAVASTSLGRSDIATTGAH